MSPQVLNVSDDAFPLNGLSLDIELGNHCFGGTTEVWEQHIRQATEAALRGSRLYKGEPVEVYIELVSDRRSQDLNHEYRDKNTPTNVLSFPGIDPDDLRHNFDFAKQGGPPAPLGDLIIADAVIAREAGEQNKTIEHHLTHLIVHGVLHLLGYDHIDGQEAEEMEALERQILAGLKIPDPYQEPDTY